MSDFFNSLNHLVLQLAVLAFAGTLAAAHVITGTDAVAIVGPIVGFGVGGAMVGAAAANSASSSTTSTTTTNRQQA